MKTPPRVASEMARCAYWLTNLTPYMAKKGYALVRKDQAEPGTTRIRGISPSASYNTFRG
jgi:hypothetical protein